MDIMDKCSEIINTILYNQNKNYSNVQVITKKDFKILKQCLNPEVYNQDSGVNFGPMVNYGTEFIRIPHSYYNSYSDVPFNKVWGVVYVVPRKSKKRLK